MAAVPVPASSRRSLIGMAITAFQARRGRPARLPALAAKVREHIPTVAMLALIDVGAFHVPGVWGAVAGFIVTGLSAGVLDFVWTGK